MRVILSTLWLLTCLGSLDAQQIKFSVEVSDDTLLVGNYFELKYTIENASPNGFEPPALSNLSIIGGPNTSTSISIVNGEMSQSASYIYYVKPDDIGTYTIPPAYLKAGEETVETPPMEIYVLPNPDGVIKPPHQAGSIGEEILVKPKEESKPKRPRKKF